MDNERTIHKPDITVSMGRIFSPAKHGVEVEGTTLIPPASCSATTP